MSRIWQVPNTTSTAAKPSQSPFVGNVYERLNWPLPSHEFRLERVGESVFNDTQFLSYLLRVDSHQPATPENPHGFHLRTSHWEFVQSFDLTKSEFVGPDSQSSTLSVTNFNSFAADRTDNLILCSFFTRDRFVAQQRARAWNLPIPEDKRELVVVPAHYRSFQARAALSPGFYPQPQTTFVPK